MKGHASKLAAAVHPFTAWRCIVSTQHRFHWVAEKKGILLQAFMAWGGTAITFIIVLRHHVLYNGLEPVNHEKALQQLLGLLSANYIYGEIRGSPRRHAAALPAEYSWLSRSFGFHCPSSGEDFHIGCCPSRSSENTWRNKAGEIRIGPRLGQRKRRQVGRPRWRNEGTEMGMRRKNNQTNSSLLERGCSTWL